MEHILSSNAFNGFISAFYFLADDVYPNVNTAIMKRNSRREENRGTSILLLLLYYNTFLSF